LSIVDMVEPAIGKPGRRRRTEGGKGREELHLYISRIKAMSGEKKKKKARFSLYIGTDAEKEIRNALKEGGSNHTVFFFRGGSRGKG